MLQKEGVMAVLEWMEMYQAGLKCAIEMKNVDGHPVELTSASNVEFME